MVACFVERLQMSMEFSFASVRLQSVPSNHICRVLVIWLKRRMGRLVVILRPFLVVA